MELRAGMGQKIHKFNMLIKKICLWGGFVASLFAVFVFFGAVIIYGIYRDDIPKVQIPDDYKPALKSQVFAANGELIAEFGNEKRILIPLGQVPEKIIQAFVAAEDKKFYQHYGIDFLGIANAVFQTLSGQRKVLRGASTITQQLAKSLLVKKEGYEQATARTMSRKIKEAILARRLEMNLTKQEILWMYLNEVYLGHGSYGVAAAAENYFRQDINKLTLGHIALLAGLPQAPSRFSPQNNLKLALQRQSYVLSRMNEDGYISNQEKDYALSDNKNLKIYPRENNFRAIAPYFSEQVRRILLDKYGEKILYEGGLRIYTTLDIDRELNMQIVLKQGLINTDKRQGYAGPIYTPDSPENIKNTQKLISKINKQNLFDLSDNYKLAWVSKLDLNNQVVFVKLNNFITGVIPLAAMKWARKREPEKNYDWMQLRSIRGVLKPGEVILVKQQKISNLRKIISRPRYKNSLEKFWLKYQAQITQNKLVLLSLEEEPALEGAMIAIEPKSGYVQAMNGGYSYDRSEFNRVYQSCRQPGSVFKPLVYLAALIEKNYTPATMLLDVPLTFRDNSSETSWKPRNFARRFRGEVPLVFAIKKSMNLPTLNLMSQVGTRKVLRLAKKLGIKTKLKHELGTGIGSSCVSMWELAQVWLSFANLGRKVEPIFIKEIKDRFNNRIYFAGGGDDPWISRSDRILGQFNNFYSQNNRLFSPEQAYTMHYLLRQTASSGTAQRTRVLNRPVAGKTGTTNDNFDIWFAGYTKNLLSLVWVGNDTMDKPLGAYEQGARTSLPLFNNFMLKALKGLPKQDWEMPATMCEARIDSQTGLRIEEDHPLSFIAPFVCGKEPAFKKDTAPKESLEQLELMGGM